MIEERILSTKKHMETHALDAAQAESDQCSRLTQHVLLFSLCHVATTNKMFLFLSLNDEHFLEHYSLTKDWCDSKVIHVKLSCKLLQYFGSDGQLDGWKM